MTPALRDPPDDLDTLMAALALARARIRVLEDELAEARRGPREQTPAISPLSAARIDRALHPLDYSDEPTL